MNVRDAARWRRNHGVEVLDRDGLHGLWSTGAGVVCLDRQLWGQDVRGLDVAVIGPALEAIAFAADHGAKRLVGAVEHERVARKLYGLHGAKQRLWLERGIVRSKYGCEVGGDERDDDRCTDDHRIAESALKSPDAFHESRIELRTKGMLVFLHGVLLCGLTGGVAPQT